MRLLQLEILLARLRPMSGICLTILLLATPCVVISQTPVAPLPATAQKAPVATDEWTGVYLGQKKVGFSSSRTSPTTYHNKPAIRESSRSVTRIVMLGAKVETDENTESITDSRHRPLKQLLDVKSNGSAQHVEALFNYNARKVFCVVGSGANATRKTLIIPTGATLTTDTSTLTEGQDLTVGKKMKFYYLQPLTVELQAATFEVTGKASVRSDSGALVSAFEVHADMPDGKLIAWAGADGSLIKSELQIGVITMSTVTETRQHALDMAYLSPALAPSVAGATAPSSDFAEATALTPDRELPHPRTLRYLKATISGIPEQNLLPGDLRQSCVRAPGTVAEDGVIADYTVRAEPFGPENASQLPLKDPAFAPYLAKAAYLEINDLPIQQTALHLRGKDTNLYKIAAHLRDWVHSVMTPDASIGVVRSAKDVFNRRRGVCRDYATLYTALARAAGVPTRLCAGIVYADGKFFYHAWAESYVGKWIAFDPTLYDASEATFVDATHIKFAQGDVTQMFDVVSIVGRLKIHIVETEPTDSETGAKVGSSAR